jgi:hypothetical protein
VWLCMYVCMYIYIYMLFLLSFFLLFSLPFYPMNGMTPCFLVYWLAAPCGNHDQMWAFLIYFSFVSFFCCSSTSYFSIQLLQVSGVIFLFLCSYKSYVVFQLLLTCSWTRCRAWKRFSCLLIFHLWLVLRLLWWQKEWKESSKLSG